MQIATVMLVADPGSYLLNVIEPVENYSDFILCIVSTQEDEKILNDMGIHTLCLKTKNFSELRNAGDKILSSYEYHLHIDSDEIFDEYFLANMDEIAEKNSERVFFFPRINLLDGKDYPDIQGRFFRYENLIWKRSPHEILYSKKENTPMDQMDSKILDYHIIHLPRRKDIRRPWW